MAPQLASHLSNPLATPDQLASSGSQLDGIPPDLEDSIRFAGARLTQAAGILLRLPQDIIAQAIVIFARFFQGPEGGSLMEYGAKVHPRGSSPSLSPNLLTRPPSMSPPPPFT